MYLLVDIFVSRLKKFKSGAAILQLKSLFHGYIMEIWCGFQGMPLTGDTPLEL